MPKLKSALPMLKYAWPFLLLYLAAVLAGLSEAPRQPDRGPGGGRPVVDMEDNTVYMAEESPRTFILTPVLWHYLSVGLSDKPVEKIPPYMVREFQSTVLGSIFPGLSDKPLAFTDFGGPAPISVEEVLEADPDAVLVWNYMSFGLREVNFQGMLEITGDGGDKTKLFRLLGAPPGKTAGSLPSGSAFPGKGARSWLIWENAARGLGSPFWAGPASIFGEAQARASSSGTSRPSAARTSPRASPPRAGF